jgi:HEAT repeat protein
VYADSIRCTGVLGDQAVASTIINRADADLHPYRLEDFVTILVGIGQPAEDELRRALVTHSETTRHLAAVALVHSPSPTAAGVLLDTLRGDNTRGVEAASYVLTELVALGVVDEASAFDTVQRLCRNIDPRVRANSVRALMLFERSGPAAELIDEMLADNDPDVILATERTVEMMRNAKIQQIFGPN